jgi:hypothetical protein
MIAGQLALVVAAVFAGAALYVNIAEQPARLMLDDQSLLIEWKPAYKRGFAMQAPLAVAWFPLGVIGMVADGRLAVAAWSSSPRFELAVYPPWHHADQQQTNDY